MSRHGSPEWLEARRAGVTSTDLPILLGLSPYRSERELAEQKLGAAPPSEETRVMRIGLALETVIRAEYQLETGRRLRRVNRILRHPEIPWALASLDFEVVGERRIVEAKSSRAGRWDDGLPQDVEAQVQWQLGVSGYPTADVAALLHGSDFRVFPVEANPGMFAGLVTVATDFRRRLDVGGPFAENAESVKRRYPADTGAEIAADPDVADAVRALISLRERRRRIEEDEEHLETAIKARMADAALLTGDGWHVVWRRTKDREETDWRVLADGLLRQLPETERTALVGLHTAVRPGFRPFRVVLDKEVSRG